MKLIKRSAVALVIGLSLWFVSFSLATRLPLPHADAALHNEPEQTDTVIKPFDRKINGHTYTISPVFDYRLKGRVVSLSDAMGWTNITHKAAGDFLNTHDFCVVWGENAETVDLRKISITHGDWTCYVQWKSPEARGDFRLDKLSNNHVLPDTPEIEEQFRDVKIGDEIEIAGQLVNYSTDRFGSRKTSTIRNDFDCEVVYVTEFRFLKRHNAALYKAAGFGRALSLVSLVMLLLSVFVFPYLKK